MSRITEVFQTLAPKLTRWDCISLLIFAVLAWVTIEGFEVLAGAFQELLILLAILFFMAVILCVLEPALKRLWSKRR